ncbi:MAG: glycosyltransferase [Micrococcus sp.]|nr:glycosyltransferase [Micrococcus sp.]
MTSRRSSATGVTVVIPHYGDPAPTRALARHLMETPGECLRGIVISDDCSPTPFTWADDGTAVPENVTVVHREVNGGFGANVNSGLSAVETELALILNSDVQISGADVDALVAAAAPYQPAVASPQVLHEDGTPQYSGRHFPTILHQGVEWLTPLARFRDRPLLHELVGHDMGAVSAEHPYPVDWVMGAVMLVPMAEVRAVGGVDESYFMNSEEVDLQLRLRQRAVPSLVIPSVSVTHEGGASSDPLKRRAWLVNSRRRYAEKWGHPRLLAGTLRAATGVNFAVNAARQLAGRDVDARATAREELALIRGGVT